MRNIILAATAIVGITALTAGIAQAQTAEPGLTTDSFASGLATGATLAPGTIAVRLRAQMWVEMSYGTDSTTKTAAGKNSGVLLGSFVRLYPKFDAKAANGLEYGATLEVRMNSGAGAGSSTANTMFARRYNGYVGTPAAGRLYFGPENNALARLAAGTTMEDFDYNGGFNGDVPAAINGATLLNWTSLRGAGFYTTNKVVYISPAFAGFSIGGSYEPSQSAGEAGLAAGGTLNPTSASVGSNNNLRRNTVDVAAQYKGSIGPVAITSFVGYITSGKVNDNLPVASNDAKYRNLSVLAAGARITFGNFAIGGTANGGNLTSNGGGGMERQGQKSGLDVITGVQYIIGPVIVGAQYVVNNTAGNYSSNYARSMLHESGIVIGGAYDYAPGATLYASALYDQRHQTGYNFASGTANNLSSNSVQGRAIQIGNTFKW